MVTRKWQLFIALALLLFGICGCHTPTPTNSSQRFLKHAIESPVTNRQIRFQSIELAQREYPAKIAHWLGRGLLNTSDPVIADYYIDKMKDMLESSIYLSLYAAKRAQYHDKIKSICQRNTGQNFPDYLVDILWDKNIAQKTGMVDQTTLWAYLCRYLDINDIVEIVKNNTPETEITQCLKFYYDNLSYLPTGNGELLLSYILQNEVKHDISEIQSKINISDGYSFCISDYGLIMELPEEQFKATRKMISDHIAEQLSDSKHISRPPAYKDAPNDRTDSFHLQKDQLTVAELLRIRLILDSIDKNLPQLSILLKNQAENTEIGGLCLIQDNAMTFVDYQPGQRAGDNRYIESARAISDSTIAIARWHIHDQRTNLKNLAGPGLDDMQYAQTIFGNIVIITALNEINGTIDYNFDLLTPQGKIIDLGVKSFLTVNGNHIEY